MKLSASERVASPTPEAEADVYLMAKSYFDLREYDRCAFFTRDGKTSRVQFVHFYARYLSGEKKRLDDMTDFISTVESQQLTYLTELRAEMEKLYDAKVRLFLFPNTTRSPQIFSI